MARNFSETVFPQNFYTSKLSEIMVFYAVCMFEITLSNLWESFPTSLFCNALQEYVEDWETWYSQGWGSSFEHNFIVSLKMKSGSGVL